MDTGLQAHGFCDRVRQPRLVFMYAREFAAVLQGHQNTAGYLTPARIMSGHKQIGDHSDGFAVSEPLSASEARSAVMRSRPGSLLRRVVNSST